MGHIPYASSKKLSLSNKIRLEVLTIFNFIKWMNASVYELVLKTDAFLQVLGNGENQFLPTIKENWN